MTIYYRHPPHYGPHPPRQLSRTLSGSFICCVHDYFTTSIRNGHISKTLSDSISVGDDLSRTAGSSELATVTLQSSASGEQITWTFDTDYYVGSYVNGRKFLYLPSGTATITSITHPSGDYAIDGTQINPSTFGYGSEGKHGYSSRLYQYDAAYNAALSLPNLVVSAGDSVVSIIGRTQDGIPTNVKICEVLTVVDTIPYFDSFMPPYAGTDKTSAQHRLSDFNYSALANMPNTASAPSYATVLARINTPGVWLETVIDWNSRYGHPIDTMPNYGSVVASYLGPVLLMMNTNITQQEKEALMIPYCQIAIEYYGLIKAGFRFTANGGHTVGRKHVVVAGGAILGNASMRDIGQSTSNDIFSEDGQYFFASQSTVDYTNSAEWDAMIAGSDKHHVGKRFQVGDIGIPDWTMYGDHSQDDFAWQADTGDGLYSMDYRYCCTTSVMMDACLAILAMGLRGNWGHDDSYFQYTDRWVEVQPLAVGGRTWGAYDSFDDWNQEMWEAYRPGFGSVWTRNNTGTIPDDNYSQGTVI